MADRQNLFPDEQLDEQPGARLGSQVSKDSFAGAQLPGDWQERAGIGAVDSKTDDSEDEDSEDDSEDEEDENGSTQAESQEASETEEEEEEAEESEAAQTEEQNEAEFNAKRNQDRQVAAAEASTGDEDEQKKSGGANQALSGALKASWENLITSFLTSIVWVDIHAFLNFIGLKMFSKLGQEWVPKEIAQSDPEKAKQMGEKLNLPETMGCCAVNGCCGAIAMIALALATIIVWATNGLFDAVTSLFK